MTIISANPPSPKKLHRALNHSRDHQAQRDHLDVQDRRERQGNQEHREDRDHREMQAQGEHQEERHKGQRAMMMIVEEEEEGAGQSHELHRRLEIEELQINQVEEEEEDQALARRPYQSQY